MSHDEEKDVCKKEFQDDFSFFTASKKRKSF